MKCAACQSDAPKTTPMRAVCVPCAKLAELGAKCLEILASCGANATRRAASPVDEERGYIEVFRAARSLGLLSDDADLERDRQRDLSTTGDALDQQVERDATEQDRNDIERQGGHW